MTVTGDIIISVVESPDKYVLRYQPLPEEQRRFLRGLVERALYPGRPIQLRHGEAASLRSRVAKLLRTWSGEQVPLIARQATADELSGILENIPTENIQAAVALMQAAMQPQEAATAKAVLDDLPTKVGLTDDSSKWSDQQLDQAFAYLESACRALAGFEKILKKYLAGQIGQYFGLSELPRNWNDTLNAALAWRKNTVINVGLSDLGGAPDSRDLLLALDDEPHNFEQVFLIRLPHNWNYLTLEQWRTMDVRDKYLARLKQAKETVEIRATELSLLSPESPSESEKPGLGKEEAPQPPIDNSTVTTISIPPSQPSPPIVQPLVGRSTRV